MHSSPLDPQSPLHTSQGPLELVLLEHLFLMQLAHLSPLWSALAILSTIYINLNRVAVKILHETWFTSSNLGFKISEPISMLVDGL